MSKNKIVTQMSLSDYFEVTGKSIDDYEWYTVNGDGAEPITPGFTIRRSLELEARIDQDAKTSFPQTYEQIEAILYSVVLAPTPHSRGGAIVAYAYSASILVPKYTLKEE